MDVHDIVYIDVPRFESLASQRLFGLTQVRTISELVLKGKTALSEYGPKTFHESGGQQTGSTREIQDLDNSFREFLEAIKGDIVELTSNLDESKKACEDALLDGHFVRAQGPFFYNDFAWLKNFSDLWSKGQEALHKMTPPTKEGRVEFESVKKNLSHTWTVADFAFGDSIECGVALGTPKDGLLVKAVLDREHLRSKSASIIERYGTKTRCRFTVLGTVARVGWLEGVEIIDALTATADEGMHAFKKTIEATQEIAVNTRRNASGGDEHSIYVMPLAVYRSSPLKVE